MPSVIDSLKVNIMGKVHILCAKMPHAQHTHTHFSIRNTLQSIAISDCNKIQNKSRYVFQNACI